MTTERDGIGIPWLWQLPESHPFHQAALVHDHEYDLMLEGKQDKTLWEVDTSFLEACLELASMYTGWPLLKLRTQAYLFFALAHTWGLVRWKGPKY